MVLRPSGLQLAHPDRRDHRYWFNQCADDRYVGGGRAEHPESHGYFWLAYHLANRWPGRGGRPDFHPASLLERNQKRARIHLTPAEREKKDGKKKPPFWTRIALILSAIGVAFSHGANDGQKGIGLVMLVLIGVAPAGFVVNMNASGYEITRTRDAVNNVETFFQQRPELLKKATGAEQLIPSPDAGAAANGEFHCHPANTINALDRVKTMLTGTESYDTLSVEQRSHLRRIMLCISDTTDKVAKLPEVSADDKRLLKS